MSDFNPTLKAMARKSPFLSSVILLAAFALPGISQARDYRGPGTVGEGPYRHQFVLRDAVTGEPMPQARYRLALPEHQIAGIPVGPGEAASVVFGVTDRQGRTVSVRLPSRHAQAYWVFDAIVGEGDFGRGFSTRGGADGKPVPKMAYVLEVEGSYLFCGMTNSRGNTYFAQSRRVRTLSLAMTGADLGAADFAWCKRAVEVIAALPDDVAPALVFRQMLGLYEAGKTGLDPDFQARIRRKLLDLALASGDGQQLVIARSLAPMPAEPLSPQLGQ
ncbi:hypothetical protein RA280_26815 [Cupriavidus sp. CV2]|uniref:hypothetical protein n=1 Tax=Cupriavidus ulmosensis TaxID=3065913 RepID=UPI00296A9BC0|nr:hypothetical protein [Cupriavidus sp. CV2]MDW3685292.1 hypothetical protein [Cupriavidus sp. CV2]